MNAINKDVGIEIINTKNLLSGSQTREVPTIDSTMIVIQDLFGFIMGEATMQFCVYTATIQDITDKEISSSLFPYATMIFMA